MDELSKEVIDDNSILLSIKRKLGIVKEYTIFDKDIIDYINSTFMELSQLGVGPIEGFSITGEDNKWTDFIPASNLLNNLIPYIYLTVKLLFDPPTSSVAVESINKLIAKHEWRINTEVEVMTKLKKEDSTNVQ